MQNEHNRLDEIEKRLQFLEGKETVKVSYEDLRKYMLSLVLEDIPKAPHDSFEA